MMVCAVYDKYAASTGLDGAGAAGKIIDGYIVEMNSEPETEKIETKFVAPNFSENETWNCFIRLYRRKETLLPLRELRKEKTCLKNAENGCQEAQR